MEIQLYQASAKNINISAEYFNFPPKETVAKDFRKNDTIPVMYQNHIICSEEKRIK